MFRVARTTLVGSGLVLCLSLGLACAPEQRSRIAELQPYAGQYPTRSKQPPPRPAAPGLRSLLGVKIVVDPGHGGNDPGARGLSALPEKSINLAVATRLAGLLTKQGARVTITRNDDRFLTLDERADIAERSRTDLFVSIHADSAQRAGASGATIYIARNATSASRRAAQSIVAAMERSGIECRGLKGAGFRVLVGHSRPAVLVECGFLTNRREARNLNSPAHQAKIAAAIADGIVQYFAASGAVRRR